MVIYIERLWPSSLRHIIPYNQSGFRIFFSFSIYRALPVIWGFIHSGVVPVGWQPVTAAPLLVCFLLVFVDYLSTTHVMCFFEAMLRSELSIFPVIIRKT